jgi:4-oxalocrotonate tautomerase
VSRLLRRGAQVLGAITGSSSSWAAPSVPGGEELIVTRTTELYVEIYGERARATTMVLVEEVPDGGWGIGGGVLKLAMLQEPAGD